MRDALTARLVWRPQRDSNQREERWTLRGRIVPGDGRLLSATFQCEAGSRAQRVSAATSVCAIRVAETSNANACVIDRRPHNPIVAATAEGVRAKADFPAREAEAGGRYYRPPALHLRSGSSRTLPIPTLRALRFLH